MRDIGTLDHDGLAVPVNLRLRQVELPVLAGEFEARHVAAGDGAQVAPHLSEGHFHGTIGLIHNVLELGQFHGDAGIDAVYALQGAEHHHVGHLLLLGRVYGDFVAQGFGADGPGVVNEFLRIQLGFNEVRTPATVGIAVLIRGQERIDERQFPAPGRTPGTHHLRLQLVITVLADVGAALIPENALGGIAHDGRHAAVPDEFRRFRPAVRLLFNGVNGLAVLRRDAGSIDHVIGHPRLNPTAAPGVDDDAHRHAQAPGEPPGKEVAHGRGLCRDGAVGVGPMGVHVFLGACFLGGLDVEHAHLRGGFRRCQNGFRGAFNLLKTKSLDGHFHVGLAGANPHFTQGNVVHGEGLLAGFDTEGVGAAGLTGWEDHAPGAVIGHLGYGLGAVPGAGDLHLGTGLAPAPHGDGGFPL